MILFCEECGLKNDLAQFQSILSKNGFVCSHCGSTTPLSSLHCQQRLEVAEAAETTENKKNKNIVWSPDSLSMDMTKSGQKTIQRVKFLALDGANFSIEAKIIDELQDDLRIRMIDDQTIEVQLLSTDKSGNQHDIFSGSAIICCDTQSDFWCKLNVDFIRIIPRLAVLPEKVNLGIIYPGIQSHHWLMVENSGTDTLKVQVKPEPDDYSLIVRFTIDGPLAMRIAPHQKKKILYSLWPVEDISVGYNFYQRIHVSSNDPGKEGNRDVVLHGKVSASAGKP